MRRSYSIIAVLALLMLPLSANAFPAKKGDKACTECHKLSKEEAETLVKKLVPDGKVTDIKVAPVKNMWQIDVNAGEGKNGVLFLDFLKKHIIIGQIIPVDEIGKEPPKRKVDFSRIPLNDAVMIGNSAAKKKVVVFTDPDCPYCRDLHKIMKQVLAKRNDITFAVVLYPLPMHKDAPKKVQAILCAKSVEMLDDAFAGKTVPAPPAACSTAAMERNIALAETMGIEGTPALIRDDGTVLSGFLPEDKLLEWIDKKK